MVSDPEGLTPTRDHRGRRMHGGYPFGFQAAAAGDGGQSDHELYRDLMEDCALGHKLGYDAAWLLEHHFSDYYPTPSPMLMMAHIAAKFPDLSLGTSVLVLPWYHPLRLAEEIAMLNSLTRGTLHLGHRPRHGENGIRCLQHRHERGPRAFRGGLPDHREGPGGQALSRIAAASGTSIVRSVCVPIRSTSRCASTGPSAAPRARR